MVGPGPDPSQHSAHDAVAGGMDMVQVTLWEDTGGACHEAQRCRRHGWGAQLWTAGAG